METENLHSVESVFYPSYIVAKYTNRYNVGSVCLLIHTIGISQSHTHKFLPYVSYQTYQLIGVSLKKSIYSSFLKSFASFFAFFLMDIIYHTTCLCTSLFLLIWCGSYTDWAFLLDFLVNTFSFFAFKEVSWYCLSLLCVPHLGKLEHFGLILLNMLS